jgi:hypothetical protein
MTTSGTPDEAMLSALARSSPSVVVMSTLRNFCSLCSCTMVGLMGGMVIKDTIQESLAIHAVRCQDAEPTPLER